DGWDFERLKNYNKPLGETAKLTLNEKSSSQAATLIKELRAACEAEISAELDLTKIEAIFFTTGVAVLSLRLEPRDKSEPDNILKYTLNTDAQLEEVHRLTEEIIKLCKAEYMAVMEQAEKRGHGSCDGSRWFLRRFREVDREDWEPALEFSYPLFFIGDQVYEQRTQAILEKVAGSKWRRKQQSDKARVSYEGAEIYVDWSEALVCRTGENRELIENNFIIALASWYALVLMNKNSSIFLFQAYFETVKDMSRQDDRPLQEVANTVNKRNMAYKDVADASLPIRWTPQRRDLFLLEAIHRNWSSDRWRKNIDERMKLLVLHYRNLEDKLERTEDERRHQEDKARRAEREREEERRLEEDERRRKEKEEEEQRRRKEDKDRAEENDRRERATNKLNRVAVMLAAFTLASATADVINLLDNGGNRDGGSSPLRTVGLILSLAIPILVWTALSLWLRLSEKRDRRKSAVSPDGPQEDTN
ncbi:MAG TPA: hypothetical protein VD861_19380, partial [Pyrinomonadaceae bacterium]|nr:hypothetical protein [Pyrinomonadaceae bacterium]